MRAPQPVQLQRGATEQHGKYTDKFFGVEIVQALGEGDIIVKDGLGSEVVVHPGGQRAFHVKPAEEGWVYWRCTQSDRMEGFPVIERTKLPWRDINYVQVSRDRRREVTWACYQRVEQHASAAATAKVGPKYGVAPADPTGTLPSWMEKMARNVAGPAKAAVVQVAARAAGGRANGSNSGADRKGARLHAYSTSPGMQGGHGAAGHEGSLLGRKDDSTSASQQVLETAMRVAKDFIEYVEEAPRRLSNMCFCGGLAIMALSMLDLLNVFQVFGHVIYYVVHCYMMFFGLVTCITELHRDTMPELYKLLEPVQRWMHEWAKGLTTLWGRGVFHIFQGTLAIMSAGVLQLGILLGIYMMMMGVAYLRLHFYSKAPAPGEEDYVLITP